MIIYLTASRASPIASSDHGVGFDLDNSIPSLLHRPYSVPNNFNNKTSLQIIIFIMICVPVGIPNSVDALWTEEWPDLMECKALSKSPGLQAVGAALNGAANRIPSRLAILYNVLLGIPTYENLVKIQAFSY